MSWELTINFNSKNEALACFNQITKLLDKAGVQWLSAIVIQEQNGKPKKFVRAVCRVVEI